MRWLRRDYSTRRRPKCSYPSGRQQFNMNSHLLLTFCHFLILNAIFKTLGGIFFMVVEYHAVIPVPNVLVHKRNLRIVVKADVNIACYCVRFTLIISFIKTHNVKQQPARIPVIRFSWKLKKSFVFNISTFLTYCYVYFYLQDIVSYCSKMRCQCRHW